jgi:hypothetical protein
VLSLPVAVKLWYCPDAVDMRLGFDGLFALVRSRLHADPLSGHLFIFRNRTADRTLSLPRHHGGQPRRRTDGGPVPDDP